jgi:hypothetical protein
MLVIGQQLFAPPRIADEDLSINDFVPGHLL